MSGSIDYVSLLSGDSSSAADSITSLIASLAGGGGNALGALKTAERDQVRDVAATAKQPQIQRIIAAFTSAVARAKTPAALLQNPDVLNVLLTANGLGDQVGYTALAQKALLSDPADPKSLANQLSNTNWKSAAQTYQFATKGLAVLQDPKTLQTLANSYAEVAWRQSLDQTTPGLSNALDFRSRASSITSVDQVLGDKTFRAVVTSALGIPPQIAFQSIGAQERAISTRLDLTRFRDPHFVESFTQQYLSAQQGGSSSQPSLDALAVQAGGLVV